ncbi:MAG: GNAT family N-acetyltransferase [Steroidobacteraceae bacterium]
MQQPTAQAAPPTLRNARMDDLPGILALYRELRPGDPVLATSSAQAALARLLATPGMHLIVCEAGGVLASTCLLAIIPNLASGARPFAVIEHVVTLQSHRRRGHGRRVLEHALGVAWSLDCCKVMLLSGQQRPEAHRLYESAGFMGDVERGFVAKPGGPHRSMRPS